MGLATHSGNFKNIYLSYFGLYTSMKNAEGIQIRYTYDKAGRNMAVENEFGAVHYGYNDADYVTKRRRRRWYAMV